MLDFAYEAEQGILLIHYFCACKATSVALCSEVKLFATTYCEQQSLYRSAVGGDLVATANIASTYDMLDASGVFKGRRASHLPRPIPI